MKTKYRLWKNYLMVARLLSTYGSLKGRQTMMVKSHRYEKLDLSQRCFRQVQRIDYDEAFSLVAMLKVCWNYVSCCIIYEILQIACQNIVSSTVSLRKGVTPKMQPYPQFGTKASSGIEAHLVVSQEWISLQVHVLKR